MILEDPEELLEELLVPMVHVGMFILGFCYVFLFISLAGLLAFPLEVCLYNNHVEKSKDKKNNKNYEMQ